jgi:aminoglycoside phosphotransferase (APT) family kinase protein
VTGGITRRRRAHGFNDDAETRDLLRSRPGEQALRWAGSLLGGPVLSVKALRGGMNSAMHLLTIRPTRGGEEASAVLRRYVRPNVVAQEPNIASREARTLQFVEAVTVPTPLLLGVDPTGSAAGVPSVLMSQLAGKVDWWPSDLNSWLGRLAELLPAIHSAALPAPGVLEEFVPYRQERYEPPGWARSKAAWERAFEIFHGPQPVIYAGHRNRTFIQRDFHPGNVLWRNGSVSGVVDWQSACIGPDTIDVGHCRVNLYSYGLDVADRFTKEWQTVSGRTYDPWADVVSIIGVLDELRDRPRKRHREAVEEALIRATDEIGASA